MKLVYVDRLPPKKAHTNQTPKHDILGFITEFLESDRRFARVDMEPGEYKSEKTCEASLRNTLCYHEIQNVRVKRRRNELYLVRVY